MKDAATKKIDVRVQKTYSKLYKTFFELLATESYESITVLEICNKTGVHRATFYKHFVDKQDFVNFCINQKLDEINLQKDNENTLEAGTKEYYINMCEQIVTFIYENQQLVSDLNIKATSSAFAQALETAIADYVEKRLAYVVTNGSQINSPIPLLSRYYAGALVALFRAWAEDWDKYTREDILKFISTRYNELDFTYRHSRNNI